MLSLLAPLPSAAAASPATAAAIVPLPLGARLCSAPVASAPAAAALAPSRTVYLPDVTRTHAPLPPTGAAAGSDAHHPAAASAAAAASPPLPGSTASVPVPLAAAATILDLFAGVGGFSNGFGWSGQTRAIAGVEFEEAIAKGFAANHAAEGALACNADINALARELLWRMTGSDKYEGAAVKGGGLPQGCAPLPPKGAAGIVMGGPPCQGFSSMNRFGMNRGRWGGRDGR